MNSQKIESSLNLSLDISEEERSKSSELETGFDSENQEWELIVKYAGSLDAVRKIATQVVELLNGYAILNIAETRIAELAEIPQIEYIEQPKELYFQVLNGKRVSCINAVQGARFSLYGQGVLIAVIDSGIDYTLNDFRKEDGSTRIRVLWDQTLTPREGEQSPENYPLGVEYSGEQIQRALEEGTREEQLRVVASQDVTGHGTAVASIAAGSGVYPGVAPESDLIIVKMANAKENGFPRTTALMLGMDYAIRKAFAYGLPVAINVSFGNTNGPHDGSSILERYMDDLAGVWKSSICVGTGNEASSAGHTSGRINDEEEAVIEFAVQERQPSLSIQIWKEYTDEIDIVLVSPSGIRVGPLTELLGVQRFRMGETQVLFYYGEPSPYRTAQEVYIELLPIESYIDGGVWRIELLPRKIVSGIYELWLPSEAALNRGTAFRNPTATTTLTIPSTASRVITIGAYDARTFAYADFSGRGPLRGENGVPRKPDVVAPGVNVLAAMPGGGYMEYTGTSFAVPFATGGAALLMEWGIINENDPYLYGEKIKAYFRRGARELPGFTQYPNAQVGYGALCVRDSISE